MLCLKWTKLPPFNRAIADSLTSQGHYELHTGRPIRLHNITFNVQQYYGTKPQLIINLPLSDPCKHPHEFGTATNEAAG